MHAQGAYIRVKVAVAYRQHRLELLVFQSFVRPVACFNVSQRARTRAFCVPFYGHRLAKVVRSRLHACVTRRISRRGFPLSSRHLTFKFFIILIDFL